MILNIYGFDYLRYYLTIREPYCTVLLSNSAKSELERKIL